MSINMHHSKVKLILSFVILLRLISKKPYHGSKQVCIKNHALLITVDKMCKYLTLGLFLNTQWPILSVLWIWCLEFDLDF